MKKTCGYAFGIVLMLLLMVPFICNVRAKEPSVVTTLSELTTAVANGDDIVLGANISLTSALYIQKNLTLDLNGHTLSLGANKVYVLSNSTFKDSSGNNSGKILGTGNYKVYVGLVSGGTSYPGSLTIESGTYDTSGSGFLRVSAPGTLKINGGVVKSTQYPVYVSASGASFNMNGGTVQATGTIGVYTVAGSEFIMNDGTVSAAQQTINNKGNSTINGGTVKATAQIGIYVSEGTLTVNGGTVQAPNDAINIKDDVGTTVTIASGTITADNHTGIYVGKGNTLTVTGGTVSAGFAAVNNLGAFVMSGGKITSNNVDDKPTIQVKGEDTSTKATFEISDGIIEALGNGSAINLHSNATATINGGTITAMFPDPEEKKGGAGITAFKDTEVTINSGSISAYSHALAGNGTPAGEPNEGENAKFTITGGSLTSSIGAGIYAPQVNGETIISGGTIAGGRTGIEIRAGSLTITGGTFSGNKDEYSYIANKNGLTTKGAAVSVCQHTTKQPITVNISGGTFDAIVPFSEVNALENPDEDITKIHLDISGGIFHSSGENTVIAEDALPKSGHEPLIEKFIWGGKYTHYVTDYVKDGYGEKIENDPIRPEPNMKAVYKWREVSWRKNVENGSTDVVRHKTTYDDGTTIKTEPDGQEPMVDPEDSNALKLRTLNHDEIHIKPNPNHDCEVSSVDAADENGNTLSVNEHNVFLAPDCNSVVTVSYIKTEHHETDHGGSDDKQETTDDSSEDNGLAGDESENNSFFNTGNSENIGILLISLIASAGIIVVI